MSIITLILLLFTMKLKNTLLFIVIGGLLALIIYRILSNKEQAEKNNPMMGGPKPPVNVQGIILKSQLFANDLQVSGSIDANEQVELRSEVSGVIQSINFIEGGNVSKGQLLIKVNDAELRAQLIQANSKQSLASENERRAKLLLQKEAISQEEYDITFAELASARAQTQFIQSQISRTSIVAPFSGKIGLRSISPGAYVTPTTLIAKLVNNDKVKITFSIPEKYAGSIKKDGTLQFTVSGNTDKFSAKIYALEPSVEQSTRTLQVRAIAENSKGILLPGTFANISLPLEEIKDAILIPTEAIIPIQNGKKVFVVANGKAKEVIIETAVRTEKSILVTSGLKPGDTLIITGIMALKPDAPVQPNIIQN